MLVSFYLSLVCIIFRCSFFLLPSQITEQKMPEGSWKCEKCGNINYPFRTKCNRQNCGADKPSDENKSPSPTADGNEQVCGVMHFCVSYGLILITFIFYTFKFYIFTYSFHFYTYDESNNGWVLNMPVLEFSPNLLKFVSIYFPWYLVKQCIYWFAFVYCSSEY